ncbi:MAG: LysR family transcriptional regulator [Bdellovibrionales bacterium]|nr:LysR family transcriptional regulator [Bdellovibrionales bacterium]
MNLNFLECFLNLSQTLNFSQTARELRIAQPAVSRQIKNLEEELGATLFVRNRQGVHLTAEGRRLRSEVYPIYSRLVESLTSFQSDAEALKGPIAFGCYREVGEKVLMPLISEFKRQYPEIVIRTNFLKANDILEDLKSGVLDFGVIPTAVMSENIRAYEILHEDSVLVTRATNEKPVTNLKEMPIVAYREADPFMVRFLKKQFSRFQLSSINYFVMVNSHKSMVEILLNHDTWAVLPYPSVEKEVKEGLLKIASETKLVSKLYLTHLENPLMEKRKVLFKQFMREGIKDVEKSVHL